MSVTRSISANSTSSSATISKTPSDESTIDPSNILYNDHQNYRIIFTNDSRFFDTSLHLFNSYCDLGYIKSENKKMKKHLYPTSSHTIKPPTNGLNKYLRPKSIGFSSGRNVNENIHGTLKSSFLRHRDHSNSHRSDSGNSKIINSTIKRENSPSIVSSQRQLMPSSNHSVIYNDDDDDSDDPDIIVTRL